jgi:hypothetical protein
MVVAAALIMIASLDFNLENIAKFKTGVTGIVDVLAGLSSVALLKAGLKAVIVMEIAVATWMMMGAFKSINETKFESNKIDEFTVFLKAFISTMTTTVKDSEGSLKSIAKPLLSLAILASIGGNLAKVISDIANLQIGTYTVKDGKFVLTGSRTLTSKDFEMVGEGFGKLLQALVGPLAIIGSDDAVWKFGNKEVNNPFINSGDGILDKAKGFLGLENNKGIQRIQAIGGAFSALTTIMTTLTGLEGKEANDNFTNSLSSFLGAIVTTLEKLGEIGKNKSVDTGIDYLENFCDALGDLEVDAFTKIDTAMTSFIANMTNVENWKTIGTHLTETADNIGKIAKNINLIDTKKLTEFKGLMETLKAANTTEGIKKVIEELEKLISTVSNGITKFEKKKEKEKELNSVSGESINSENTEIIKEKIKEAKKEEKNNAKDNINVLWEKIIGELSGVN